MERLLVVGGQQRSPRALLDDDQNWYKYKKGIIVQATSIDDVEICLEYVSPAAVRADDDPVLFKSGTLCGQTLFTCTQTEILTYTLPTFECIGYISLPWFNDVHHVLPTPHSTLLIANSGLDMVLELARDGEVLSIWNVNGEDPWQRFAPTIDYRHGVNTKPHAHHPNHLFYIDADIWVTRFERRDAVCLTSPGQRIDIGIERVHDGIMADSWLYFTTVDGNVVIVNPTTRRVEEVIDLKMLGNHGALLGWCRGILMCGNVAYIGFSRIRPTRFREKVSWVRTGFQHSLPTHVGRYDLVRRRHLDDIDLESHGLNAVFSIFLAPDKSNSREEGILLDTHSPP